VLNDCVLYSWQSDRKPADPKTAVQFAKHLQNFRGAVGDVVKEREVEENVGRRKTVRNIHNTHHNRQKKQPSHSLDTNFKRQLLGLRKNDGKDMIHCVALLHELTKFLFTTLWHNPK